MTETQLPPVVEDPSDDLAALKAARAWLDDPGRFTTGSYWRDAGGESTQDRDEVVRTCAYGALRLVAPRSEPNAILSRATREMYRVGVISTNDGPDGYRNILAAYDLAIAKLEAQRDAG